MVTVASNMKLFLIISLLGVVLCEEYISYGYHERVGIKKAAEASASTKATDFDGSRIVGGNLAPVGSFPHFAGLAIILTNGLASMCGSTMLTNTRAVTAAHCWNDGRIQAFSFTLIFASSIWMAGGTRVITRDVEMHQNFNPLTATNNIAIIQFPWVAYTNNIRNIVLPGAALRDETFTGYWASTCGFGRISDQDHGLGTNQFLFQVPMQVITNAACAQVYGPQVVTAGTLCASGEVGRSICQGDMGGPLDVTVGANRVLIGISSFVSESGCERGFPGGFTRVSSYLDWIIPRI